MKTASLAATLCAVLLIPTGSLRAQDYMGVSESKPRKSEPPAKPEKKGKKGKKAVPDEPADPAQKAEGEKKNINVYLKVRLKQLEDAHRAQEAFGKRMAKAWDDFWTRSHNSRKEYDVSIARNRLNHLQSLATLNAEYHKQMTGKFEDLQTLQSQSFEKSQKKELEEFFAQLQGDIRAFQAEQDKWLANFMAEAAQAWQEQKQDGKP